MTPISRRYAGTSVMRCPSMAISPPSGIKHPATRWSGVVFPPPDGPSSVISARRRTNSDTASRAVILPNGLVTPARSTAACSLPFVPLVTRAGAGSAGSAGMLNVENLREAEKRIGQCQHRCGGHNVHDRYRGHRRVRVFAHVVVERNRQRLCALYGHEQRGGKLVERKDCREPPRPPHAGPQQRQWARDQHAARPCAHASAAELQARI